MIISVKNKVQEAVSKWSDIKKTNQNIKLHMIGNYKAIRRRMQQSYLTTFTH